jgi:exodeoxyribonuclease VII small subunit
MRRGGFSGVVPISLPVHHSPCELWMATSPRGPSKAMGETSGGPAGKKPTLADELARLEEIVRRLEADDLDLDGALALFEQGVACLRSARERLAAAEVRVRTVVEDANGTLRLGELDG